MMNNFSDIWYYLRLVVADQIPYHLTTSLSDRLVEFYMRTLNFRNLQLHNSGHQNKIC